MQAKYNHILINRNLIYVSQTSVLATTPIQALFISVLEDSNVVFLPASTKTVHFAVIHPKCSYMELFPYLFNKFPFYMLLSAECPALLH